MAATFHRISLSAFVAFLPLKISWSDCRKSKCEDVKAVRLNSNYKIIHFVRHAEGEHNAAAKSNRLAYLREDLQDAHITATGKEQCEQLRSRAQDLVKSSELVIVSPLSRTMETAELSFPQLIGHIPWISVENVRERTGLHPCDKRKSVTYYKHTFPHIDFTWIESNEDPLHDKYTPLREPEGDIILRAKAFLDWLAKRPEREVIVVSHDGYLRTLLTKAIDSIQLDDEREFVKFENCEMRTFVVAFPISANK